MRHPALLGRTVYRLVVELLLRSTQREHQVEHLLVDHLGTTVRLVDLVDHYDRLLAQRQRLLQYKTRLRHSAFEGIHQKQHAVAHVQHTLHLAAEIGVSGRIYYIDFIILVYYRYVLRENRNTSFAFQIIVVENQLSAGLFVVAEQMPLHYHLVDERRLAMVDMRDDRYIA